MIVIPDQVEETSPAMTTNHCEALATSTEVVPANAGTHNHQIPCDNENSLRHLP